MAALILKHITVHACDGMQSLIRDPMTEINRPSQIKFFRRLP